MHALKPLLVVVLLTSAAARAGCTAESAPTRAHLVELYSSEGCSSCPPAENWLRSLHTGADVVPLEFHVDYWDSLGWRDRFADARYTTRQESIAARDGGAAIYTPQVALDGRSWAGWYRGGTLTPPTAGTLSLKLSAQPGTKLHVQVEAQADGVGDLAVDQNSVREKSSYRNSDFRNYVALVEDDLNTQVQAGENRGALLKHDHVVRAFAGPLSLAQAQIDLVVPSDVDLAHASLVAFAQNPRDGAVAQVVTLPLKQCR